MEHRENHARNACTGAARARAPVCVSLPLSLSLPLRAANGEGGRDRQHDIPSPCAPPLSPSSVSPLAALEYSPALSVDRTVPPRRAMADSNDSRVRVDGS